MRFRSFGSLSSSGALAVDDGGVPFVLVPSSYSPRNSWLGRNVYLVGGIPTPLKNDGVRQLG